MEKETAIIIFRIPTRGVNVDLEVPLFISANDLVVALNTSYSLGIDVSDVKNCFLKAERPIVLLRGNRTLSELGVRNGTVINFDEEQEQC